MIVATVFIVISFALIGYLFGSILFGVIVARISKTNLRATGSQNVGGTNVSRTLGKKFGILVSVLDSTKSYLTVVVCWIIFRYSIFEWFIDSEKLYPLIYIGGIFAVIGHCWPLQYVKKLFITRDYQQAKTKSGGKGVATTGGMLFAISPWLGLISFGTFVLILICTRYVSLGSMICMFIPAFLIFVVPLDNFYLFDHSLLYSNDYHPDTWGRVIFLIEMLCNSAIVFIRHKPNIQRLWKHEEKRFF